MNQPLFHKMDDLPQNVQLPDDIQSFINFASETGGAEVVSGILFHVLRALQANNPDTAEIVYKEMRIFIDEIFTRGKEVDE